MIKRKMIDSSEVLGWNLNYQEVQFILCHYQKVLMFFYPSNTLIFCFLLTHTKLAPTLLSKSNRVQNTQHTSQRTQNRRWNPRKRNQTLMHKFKPRIEEPIEELWRYCVTLSEIENPAAILKKNACESESS